MNMNIVNNKEMQLIDQETIEKYSIPSSILTENAGIQLGLRLIKIYPKIKTNQIKNIFIFSGPGNNGADAIVLARFLSLNHIQSKIFLIAKKNQIIGNLELNFNIIKNLKLKYIHIEPEDDNIAYLKKIPIYHQTLFIDAIFGTGLKTQLTGFYKKFIEEINLLKNQYKEKLQIISIDVPSGLINMEDQQSHLTIKADHTLTIGLPKIGLIDYPGFENAGKIHLVTIGFPKKLLQNPIFNKKLLTFKYIQSILPKRHRNTHKGDYGHLLIIAGSDRYLGAPSLVASAALRSGVGKISLISTKKACQIALAITPEILAIPSNKENILENIRKNYHQYSAIVFGPGIDRKSSHIHLLEEVLNLFPTKPIVIDADGLWVLKQLLQSYSVTNQKIKNSTIILTPHIKEMSELVDLNKNQFLEKKIQYTFNYIKQNNFTILLKSAISIIFYQEKYLAFNIIGNEGMATSGSGDVLAGILGAFLSSSLEYIRSCELAVFIHALSGDIASKYKRSFSLIASDIIQYLPEAFKKLEKE